MASSSAVQLGYPGEYLPHASWSAAPSSTYTAVDDAYTDKAGGAPMWHSGIAPPATPECVKCGRQLMLVCQSYLAAPTEPASAASASSPPALDRFLYIFACNHIECCLSEEPRCCRVLRLAWDENREEGAIDATATAASAAPKAALKPAASSSTAAAKPATPAKPAAATKAAAPKSSEFGSVSWSSDEEEEPAAKASKPSSSVSAAAPVAATAVAGTKTPTKPAASSSASSSSEFGSASWSSDEDEDAPSSPSKPAPSSTASDADALLSSLLAKQTLSVSASKAARSAAEEAAAKKEAERMQKQAEKKERAKQQAEEEAREELVQRALEARGENAAASSGSSSASAAVPTPAAPVQPPPSTSNFRPFYLAWSPEPAPLSNSVAYARELRLLQEYEQRQKEEGESDPVEVENSTATSNAEDDDDDAEKREEDVQAFFDRIERMPTQCVRYYGRSGPAMEPAPASVVAASSSTSSPTVSTALFVNRKELEWHENASRTFPCPHCRAPRVLEVQLMPNLLYELHVDTIDKKDPGMDWTTIDVYTCPNSCQPNAYVEELLHVQPPL